MVPSEIRAYYATHVPFRSWCPHCVRGRRPNQQHRSQSGPDRRIPLFCADYCFVRDSADPALETVLAGRLYPSRSVFATVCDSKGVDEPAVLRLSNFLRESGVSKLVYKTDQESAIKVMIEEASVALASPAPSRPMRPYQNTVPLENLPPTDALNALSRLSRT